MSRTDRLGTQRDVEDLAAAALLEAIASHAQRTEADWQRQLERLAEADKAGRTRPGACFGVGGFMSRYTVDDFERAADAIKTFSLNGPNVDWDRFRTWADLYRWVDLYHQAAETERTLRMLEWSSMRLGQSSGGYMGAPNDGPLIPACPICQSVKPSHPRAGDFMAEVIGHRPDCLFNKLAVEGQEG